MTIDSTAANDSRFAALSLKDSVSQFVRSSRSTARHSQIAPDILNMVGDARVGDLDLDWAHQHIAANLGRRRASGRRLTERAIKEQFRLVHAAVRWSAQRRGFAEQAIPPDLHRFARILPPSPRSGLLPIPRDSGALRPLFLHARRSNDGWAELLELAVATGARLGELADATWGQFDPRQKFWTIPGDATTGKRPRSVPLSKKALHALKRLQAPRPPDGKVFPWLGSPERASATLGKFARQAGMDGCRSLDLRDMALHRAFAKWGLPPMAVGLVFGCGSETLVKRFADWSRLQAPSASIRRIAPWLSGDAPAPLPFHWSALASAPSANMLAPIRH